MGKNIARFVDCCEQMPSDFILSLKAGFVGNGGEIVAGQLGAIDTFCIGMPMYSLKGKMLGRLELSYFDNLDYTKRTEEGIEIPVEKWKIKGYTGPFVEVLTYYQAKDRGLIKRRRWGMPDNLTEEKILKTY